MRNKDKYYIEQQNNPKILPLNESPKNPELFVQQIFETIHHEHNLQQDLLLPEARESPWFEYWNIFLKNHNHNMSRQTDIIELQQISQRCLDIAQELLPNSDFTAMIDLPGSIQALKQLACHNKPTPVLASLARVLACSWKNSAGG